MLLYLLDISLFKGHSVKKMKIYLFKDQTDKEFKKNPDTCLCGRILWTGDV